MLSILKEISLSSVVLVVINGYQQYTCPNDMSNEDMILKFAEIANISLTTTPDEFVKLHNVYNKIDKLKEELCPTDIFPQYVIDKFSRFNQFIDCKKFIRSLSNKHKIKVIEKFPIIISQIKNPSDNLINISIISSKGVTILNLPNLQEKYQIMAIKQNYELINYVKNPSKKLIIIACALYLKDNPIKTKQDIKNMHYKFINVISIGSIIDEMKKYNNEYNHLLWVHNHMQSSAL
jgi:hypothetical protein